MKENEKKYERFITGMKAVQEGQDESDAILCPYCGWVLALNEDDCDMNPKHCPECGTKIIY